ncbi:MAG: hypothetical protein ABIQ74_13900, partial [Chitinophagales bacterium]
MFLSCAQLYAQEQPNPTRPNPNNPNSMPPNPARPMQQGSKKDDLVQKLNEFQPKLNDLSAKAKENEAKFPDYTREVNKLRDMVAAFKSKLDKFDITQRDQQDDYASSLQSDWQAIESQYNKANDLWIKAPNEEVKPKKPQEQQIPPK